MAESSAPLRPSAGHRWVSCPGSMQLITSLPETQRDNANKDAMWGTACHEVLSRSLIEKRTPGSFVGESIVVDGEVERRDFPNLADRTFVITEEDAANVSHAYNYAISRMEEYAKLGKTEVLVEEKVDIGENFHVIDPVLEIPIQAPLPGYCSGTPDIVIAGSAYVEVIDYKNGQRPVSHENNPQLLLYLIGVLKRFTPPQRVRLTIVQPRAEGLDPVRTEELTMAEAEERIFEVSAAAHATRMEGAPLVPGDHCRNTFCPAQGICPALNGVAVAALQGLDTGVPSDDLDEPPDPTNAAVRMDSLAANIPTTDLVTALTVNPEELALDQLSRILDAREMIRSWINACEAYAHRLMMSGETVPGFKLVMGRRDRKWGLDEDKLLKKFSQWGRIGDDGKTVGKLKREHYTVTSVISPAQAEKRIKPMVTPKTWEHIEACYEWSEGKLTIAPETDKREAVSMPNAAEVLGIDSGPSDLPEFLQ